jgi:hypothetical protein
MIRSFTVISLVFFILALPWEACAVDRKKDLVSMYEVPTTGKILDVEYRPEFDEWWVKCREGDGIAVYSYDKRGQKWGKIVFSPKKTETAPAGEPLPPSPRDLKSEETAKGQEKKTEKPSKWWDPLNIIKGGERLIVPPPSDGRK